MRVSLLLLLFISLRLAAAKVTGIYWSDGSVDNDIEGAPTNITGELDDTSDYCYLNKSLTQTERCNYVKSTDDCDGGGYLPWTNFVVCEPSTAPRVIIIAMGVIYLLILFITISTTADDFFSPSVAGIVAHLGISESITGVTFMAFGNGSPDIFGSIASVVSSSSPKAGLAIGELLGSGIFITLIVTATIVFTREFKAAKFETVRDLIFFIIAMGWILFIFLYDDKIHLFEPLVLIGIYIVYVFTVVLSHFLHKRRTRQKSLKTLRSKVASLKNKKSFGGNLPDVHVINTDGIEKKHSCLSLEEKAHGAYRNPVSLTDEGDFHEIQEIKEPREKEDGSANIDLENVSTSGSDTSESQTADRTSSRCELVTEDDEEEEEENQDMIWIGHGQLVPASVNHSRNNSILSRKSIGPPPSRIKNVKTLVVDIWETVTPIDKETWNEGGKFSKAFLIIRIPIYLILRLTIPYCERPWSKGTALIHCLFCPQFIVFAVQVYTVKPVEKGPHLFVYTFAVTIISALFITFFTSFNEEPKYYKRTIPYFCFVMSIAWIYLISTEVVSVVTMIGLISGLSHEILGLTILAWSNSIGDVIADIAVVKQGYPNMALAAAIGGPLFNLLIGFGVPFTIACLRSKKPVQIAFITVNRILVLFLSFSLVFTLVALFIQRFKLRRVYAVCLCVIYAVFLLMVILAEAKVYHWGPIVE